MKFARSVFWLAGVWGFVILVPLYFLYDFVGKQDPPPLTHPQFYFGFVGVALVWQIAFFVIASDPQKFRPFIWVAVLEKASYVVTILTLAAAGKLGSGQWLVAVPDATLGVLFAVAYGKVATEESQT